MDSLALLVQAAQKGDADAFNALIERFQDMARASAYAMLGDHQLAEDAAQEAFIEAFLTLDRLRAPAAFLSWFRCILFKQADRLTRGRRLTNSSLEAATDVAEAGPDLDELVESQERAEQVRHAISALSQHERQVITLFYGTGYALRELAAFLDVPVTTVKKRLYDARQRLKGELLDSMGEVLHGQRPANVSSFPASIRLLIAARTGDLATVQTLLARNPGLLNLPMTREEVMMHVATSVRVGITPLHEAAQHNNAQMTDLLLAYGARIDARSSDGRTPLHGAVMLRCHTSAAVLLEHGADTEQRLYNGFTALHLASMHGDDEMLRLLLAHGADLAAQSQHARTALHWAALKGHRDAVRLLLDHGGNPCARDHTGRTPGDWARTRGHMKIVTDLQERMRSL